MNLKLLRCSKCHTLSPSVLQSSLPGAQSPSVCECVCVHVHTCTGTWMCAQRSQRSPLSHADRAERKLDTRHNLETKLTHGPQKLGARNNDKT